LIADTVIVNYSTPLWLETYQYNSNGTPASFYQQGWNGSTWNNSRKTEYNYDANNNLSDYTGYTWSSVSGSYTPTLQRTYTYNAFHQLTSFNDGTFWRRLYYSPSTIHVPEVDNDGVSLQLFPVPATAYINLQLDLDTKQDIKVTITDMNGRIVKHWNEQQVQHYKKFIPIMDLTPGNYSIHISGRGSQSRTFSVIR
jgi:hypothetical protein